MSKEWGRFKVNVNCVVFGFIETRLTQATDEKMTVKVDGGKEANVGIPPKIIEGFIRMIPLGRAGTTEEAADAVFFTKAPPEERGAFAGSEMSTNYSRQLANSHKTHVLLGKSYVSIGKAVKCQAPVLLWVKNLFSGSIW